MLDGRVALVTGGARGIGAAIVRALHAAGASVVIADSGTGIDGRGENPVLAADLARELGERAVAFAEDLAKTPMAAHAVALANDRFGGLDIVVNNAAILRDALVFKAEIGDVQAVLRTNLVTAFELLRAATELMREQAKAGRGGVRYRWGRIVNVVSTAGLYGNLGQSAYAASKAGLVGLTRVVAHDMARTGVAVNAVAPFGATRVTESIVPQNEAQAAYKAEALQIDARYVGRFVAFLASDAGEKITGQLFGVRGPQTFLFSQPRPVACFTASGDYERQVRERFEPHFVPLETDLEAFSNG
ncbi:MAG: SDR family NAD(P)-dependent oxidoreductase [Candidatus Eremiobacteraeota bacterium]|nr:SDR family NAD(P)-dependent oxidoreductase [Candidatus Eremiobacteraeota bacterium]